MARIPTHAPLLVLLNNRLVGRLIKKPSGEVRFQYDQEWLGWKNTFAISLSLPLRPDEFSGGRVIPVFDNLLPDRDEIRRRIAGKVGAGGTDMYDLLAAIGQDCVGALQFVPDDGRPIAGDFQITGTPVTDLEIEQILLNLEPAPLGLDQETEFRISVAGAQQKTALLWHEGRWWKPSGTTPTTHIFKTQIGNLPNGIDLTNSVENEFYCMKLAAAFGLPVAEVEMVTFGRTKALVVERFDRQWTRQGRLLRIPQEDICQALSVPVSRKYQTDGGPGMVDILNLLQQSDRPGHDQDLFLRAQILFWMIGATDGHAKNFSLVLRPGGGYVLAPLYDILTAEPALATNQITRRQMKLAMSVGDNNHYRIDQIAARHFEQTAKKARMGQKMSTRALYLMERNTKAIFQKVEEMLPVDFPMQIHDAVREAALRRAEVIRMGRVPERD